MWGECWEIKDKIGEKKISGGQKFWGGTFGGNAKKRGKTCVGGMLGNKRQDRGKKNFRGPEILGGNFWGKCPKKGGKLFWGECWGAVNPNKF